MLNKKNILVGITGAIATYKACELIRIYKKAGANVKVIITPNTLEFIGIKTLETLSENKVHIEPFEVSDGTKHISLADWADIFVLAPLSANTLSKISTGIADNLLCSVACAILGKNIPIIIAPSMNDGMWNNVFVKENINKLKNAGVFAVEPEFGYLACGTIGTGRLADINKIFDKTIDVLNSSKPLAGKKILITGGGTKEYIDPVRYISNASSGKMATSLAICANKLGAEVTLISTFDYSADFKIIKVNSASEMKNEVEKYYKNADVIIMAAAVSDYCVKNISNTKIDKEKNENLTLELVKNTDILKYIGQNKKDKQILIGFSLSTENLEETAFRKLKIKNCDYIIANEANNALGTNDTEILIVGKSGIIEKTGKISKIEASKKILELIK